MIGRRVLLIDDEDDIREIAQLCLEMVAQWEVLSASSGAEGLVIAASDQPDAIVLDVMMPVMDGPTTFKLLRANPATQHIPVVLLTAKVAPAGGHGIDVLGVIQKPFDPLRLSAQIASALGWTG